MTLHHIERRKPLSLIQVLYDRVTDNGATANIYVQHTDEWRPLEGTAPNPRETPQFILRCHKQRAPWGEMAWPSTYTHSGWWKHDETGEFVFEEFSGTKWYSTPGHVGVDYLLYKMPPDVRQKLGIAKRMEIIRVTAWGGE